MDNPLATYLADHLAGSVHAIELLKALEEQRRGQPLGRFAADLLVEIAADQAVVQRLADKIGTGSNRAKELTAWLGEKLSRFKLRHDSDDLLGTFEALEFLELGIHGKWALWRALAALAPTDVSLQNLDYDDLATRAQTQRDRVEEQRLRIAREALQKTPRLNA